MAGINPKQMEAFMAVMQFGSITAAAKFLNLSQPSVSRIIERFEHDAGFAAFKRERGKIVPTPEAEIFYNESRIFYRGVDYLNKVAKEISGITRGYLRFGVFPALSTAWIAERIDRFIGAKGSVLTTISTLTSDQIIEGVARHSIDVGISAKHPDRPDLDCELIWRTDLVAILPTGHKLCDRPALYPADFAGEEFISLSSMERFRTTIDALFDDAGIERRIRVEVPQVSSICHLVGRGMGLSLVNRFTANEYSHLGYAIVPFEPKVDQQAYLITPRHFPQSVVVDEFCALLKADFGQEGSIRGDSNT